MMETLVFGHKNPDTDSVASAIALANLKNKLNEHATPRVLGNINNETSFVLDYFDVAKPKFLNDVKLQIKDVKYQKDTYVTEDDSILNVLKFMETNNLNTIPVVESATQQLQGVINLNHLLQFLINSNFRHIKTTRKNLLESLNATDVLFFDEKIAGYLLVAAYESQTFINQIDLTNDTILIVGDRPDIQEHAINKGIKLLIVANDFDIKPNLLKKAEENKVNIIKTSFDSYTIAHLSFFANLVSELVEQQEFLTFRATDYVSEFKRAAKDSEQLCFPVLNDDNTVSGIITLDHLDYATPKKVILVDHNETNQSVTGIEEANILEVIDHHKIGNMTTAYPINFRNMIVGSTCTIVYHLYQENNVTIDQTTAGLLMAGIISDTLMLQSPTTTEVDRKVLNELNKITDLDCEALAEKMFEAGSTTQNMTPEEIIYSDFKNFTVRNHLIGLGQFKTTNPNDIKENLASFQTKIEQEAKDKNYYVLALFITDIRNNGSYIIYNKTSEKILKKAFELPKISNWVFISDKISRKQQMIPRIIDAIEKTH